MIKIIKALATLSVVITLCCVVLTILGQMQVHEAVSMSIMSFLPSSLAGAMYMLVALHDACFPPPDRRKIQSFARK